VAVVFARESGFHRFSQALARLILGLMIEKDIGPLMPAPAVHMDEYRSLISFFIFPAQAVILAQRLSRRLTWLRGIGLTIQVSR